MSITEVCAGQNRNGIIQLNKQNSELTHSFQSSHYPILNMMAKVNVLHLWKFSEEEQSLIQS